MANTVDGGSGWGSCTPWYDYPLPVIWAIVNSQDTDKIWRQASGWKNTADLTSRHLFNLKEYKNQLAEAWPPERSPAAAAYLAELDKLIVSVQETHDTASANYDAVKSLALAVDDARYKLKPLYEEYVSNQRKLDEFDQRFPDVLEPIFPSPVADGRQDWLNNEARSVMCGISGEIVTAGIAIRPPAPYKPPIPRTKAAGPGVDADGASGVGSAGIPILIPPPVRSTPPVPRPAPNTSPLATSAIRTGPELSGTLSTTPPAPPASRLLPPGIQPAPVPGPNPALPPLAPPVGPAPLGTARSPLPGLGGPAPSGPNTGVTGPLPGGGGRVIGANPGAVGMRAMPPGGVIGGSPGAGLARPGAAQPMSRVNPSGGVIGGQAGAPFARGGRPGQRQDEQASPAHWDPDRPWEIDQGVAPVVLPANAPRRQDPGPVIGRGQ